MAANSPWSYMKSLGRLQEKHLRTQPHDCFKNTNTKLWENGVEEEKNGEEWKYLLADQNSDYIMMVGMSLSFSFECPLKNEL